mgnify:CR=1 FL=1
MSDNDVVSHEAVARKAADAFGVDHHESVIGRPKIMLDGGPETIRFIDKDGRRIRNEVNLPYDPYVDALTEDDGSLLVRDGYVQREYLAGMEQAYAAADLIVARSGAGTVCEVSAVGLPAVYVPLPIGNGEQALNARPVVEAEGALLVRDDAFGRAWVQRQLIPLATDPERLARMGEAAARFGVRDADVTMAGLVRSAAQEGARR